MIKVRKGNQIMCVKNSKSIKFWTLMASHYEGLLASEYKPVKILRR